MDPQLIGNADKEFERALRELNDGNVLAALARLESALKFRDNPGWYSYLGFCVAKERGHVTQGFKLCQEAIDHDPENPDHYLYMGKVHLIAGNRDEALLFFRQGMAQGGNQEITQLLNTLGTRKPPIIPFLSRDNPLNKQLGILLSRLNLR
jgi:tetratricopeptide (TPR) repeat protein